MRGQILDDCIHLDGKNRYSILGKTRMNCLLPKSHVQNSIRLVNDKHLEIVTTEVLIFIHMLKEATGSANYDVDSGKPALLKFNIRSFKISYFTFIFQKIPPIRRAAENSWCAPTLLSTWNIWKASSLVGVIIKAPSPSNLVQRFLHKDSSNLEVMEDTGFL
jgi:hypothetical protein